LFYSITTQSRIIINSPHYSPQRINILAFFSTKKTGPELEAGFHYVSGAVVQRITGFVSDG